MEAQTQEKQKAARVDTNRKTSERKGFAGYFESALRRFRGVLHGLLLLPFYGLAALSIGVGLVPGLYLFNHVSRSTVDWSSFPRYLALGTSLGAAFFLYGFTLIFYLPVVNFLLRAKLNSWRGPYYSLESVRWYIHNGAVYLIRYTFLEFVCPSPFINWFYSMMGMKIGHGTIINSTHISDPSLIEMGAKVTIGGSATIVGHYGQGGYLVLSKVSIGDNVTIGLKATIMAGVTIGKGAKVLANSVVLPNTTIPDGETWGGVPAQKISVIQRRVA